MPITYKTVFSKAIADFNAIQNAIASKGSIPNLDSADNGNQVSVTTADSSNSSKLLRTDVMPDEIKKYLVYPSGNLSILPSVGSNPVDEVAIGNASNGYYTVRIADAVPTSTDSGYDSFNREGYEFVKIKQGSITMPSALTNNSATATLSGSEVTLTGTVTNAGTGFSAGWIAANPSGTTTLTLKASLTTQSKTANDAGTYTPDSGKILTSVVVPQGSLTITPASTLAGTKLTSGNTESTVTDILLSEIPASGDYYTIVSDPSASQTTITSGWMNSDDITIVSGTNLEKYIKKATHTPTVTSLTAPSVALTQTATGIQTSETATDYYVTVTGTGTNGSVKATETHTTGYDVAGSQESAATTITPGITGSGDKIYIKEGSVSSTASVTEATVGASSGLTLETTVPSGTYYTITPYAKASSAMTFIEGYIKNKGTEGAMSSNFTGTAKYIKKSTNGGASSYTGAIPSGDDNIQIGHQQKVVLSAGYYPNARTIYSVVPNLDTQASNFHFEVTESGSTVGNSVLVAAPSATTGYYDLTADNLNIEGTLTADTPGWFSSTTVNIADSDVDGIKVGRIAASTHTNVLTISDTSLTVAPTLAVASTGSTISGSSIEGTLPSSGYYVKVNAAVPSTGNTVSVSASATCTATAGYTPGGTATDSDSATVTVSGNADKYVVIPTGSCTVAGGGLTYTDVSTSPSNKGAAKTNGALTDNYVSVTVGRNAITDAHTAGYIPTKSATTAIAADSKTVKIAAMAAQTVTISIADANIGAIGTATTFNSTTGAADTVTKTGSTEISSTSSADSISTQDKYMLGNITVAHSDKGTVTASINADASGANVDEALESLYKRMLGLQYNSVSADA